MKSNILKIIFISLVAAVATGCSDFLDENPRSSLTSNSFFETPAQAHSSVNSLYRVGFPTMYSGGVYNGVNAMLGGYVSGYYDNEYSGQEVVVMYSKSLSRSPVNIANQMDNVWDGAYAAINRANSSIKYIPEVEGIDQSQATQLVAEAKFFRAANLFNLVKMFGDVPFTPEPYESLEDLYLARTSSVEIYSQIISDLKDAASVLPKTAFYNNGNRITSNVVNSLLANVYLQASGYPVKGNYYADAAAAAKAVINSGDHSLVQNENLTDRSAFNILRTEDGVAESIYAYEYNSAISRSPFTQYSFPNRAAGWGLFKYAITNNAFGATNGLTNVYNPDDDIRIQNKQFFMTQYERPDTGETEEFENASWYYFDEEAMLETARGTKDFNIYRYAEILLIAAEAIAESEGVTSEAAGYLAKVKARASLIGKNEDDFKSELTGLSKDEFVKEVWAEKIREFPLEFKLWDDIIRTRQYPQFKGPKGFVSFVNVIGASNNWGKTFQEKDLLWPLSANELQRNPELTQNPGYQDLRE